MERRKEFLYHYRALHMCGPARCFFLISSYIVVHLLYICATHENGVSVRPSVRQSHAGIGSRLINIGSCGFHHCVAQLLYFLTPNFIPHVWKVCEGLKRDWSGDKYSPAVAKRSRDASCLSVVSFNSSTRRAQSSIISYFGVRFTAAYNWILFRSLLFHVFTDAWRPMP